MNQVTLPNTIEAHIERLVETWSAAVRNDPRIESDADLSKPELIDHIPAIISEICMLIRNGEMPGVRNSHEARANVYTRFHQGYKGRDLIRELSLLRVTLLDYVAEISSAQRSGITPEERHNTATIINLYLDEEMRYAISVYSNPSISPQPENHHKGGA
jgi:hypothetical protein